ncbi:MAG: hypothetical protein GX483_01075 [Actinomycetaceae bacterium]|nr:hypothetical protein [Actinomycetaceae bacterium]
MAELPKISRDFRPDSRGFGASVFELEPGTSSPVYASGSNHQMQGKQRIALIFGFIFIAALYVLVFFGISRPISQFEILSPTSTEQFIKIVGAIVLTVVLALITTTLMFRTIGRAVTRGYGVIMLATLVVLGVFGYSSITHAIDEAFVVNQEQIVAAVMEGVSPAELTVETVGPFVDNIRTIANRTRIDAEVVFALIPQDIIDAIPPEALAEIQATL